MTDRKSKEEKEAEFTRISEKIWRIIPNIQDFDQLQYVLRPYVMRMPAAHHQSRSLNTDAHGFRRLVVKGETVSYDQFCNAPEKKGVLLGDSTIFGYGLADNETLQAQLSRRNGGSTLWYNFAAPVANILQNRLAMELFLPGNVQYVTLVISMSAPVIYLLSSFDTKPYPVLFGQSTDAMFNAGAVTQKKSPRFKLSSGIEINDPREAFQFALDDLRRNIHLMASALQTLTSTKLLVCFRPNPIWIDKPLAPQERMVMDLFVAKHKTHIALSIDPELQSYWREYVEKIEALTHECGADFIDLNKTPELNSSEWLFFDHFHQNAAGLSHIARQIGDWADQTTTPPETST